MRVIGLTGGVAAGKSNVRRHFSVLKVPTIDADRIVAKLYKDKKISAKIKKEFGTADKRKIAEIVFSNKARRKRLESILHPPVLREIRKILQQYRKKKEEIVVVELPLLFEIGMQKMFHKIIVVKTSRMEQIRRLIDKGLSLKEALRRINSLMPMKEKLKRADYVIDSSGTKAQTRAQTRKIYNKLLGE